MKKPLSLLILIISIVLAGCGFTTYQLKEGNEISAKVRDDIDNLNIKLFQAVKGGDFMSFTTITSAKLRAELNRPEVYKAWQGFSILMQNRSFLAFNEFYIKSILPGNTASFHLGADKDEMIFSFTPPAAETVVSFRIVEDTIYRFLLSATYGKFDGKWLLNGMNVSLYSVLGQTAPSFYEKAKEMNSKKYLIDAVLAVSMYNKCVHATADTLITFIGQQEMDKFCHKVVAAAQRKYPLPYTLNGVKSKPKLLNIEPSMSKRKIIPCVSYLTTIKLTDVIALKAENREIQQNIADLFYGLKENNPDITYRAYNKLSEDGKDSESYEFTSSQE